MTKTSAYITGVGYSSQGKDALIRQISAATKALLDAGITFDHVSHGVTGEKISPEAMKTFDSRDSIKVNTTKSGEELNRAVRAVTSEGAQCVLLIANVKESVVSLVVASEDFVWHHPYLKDSSVIIQCKGSSKPSAGDLEKVCNTVWQLRGWSKESTDNKQTVGPFELCTVSSKVPSWEDIQHRQDGKHRLGHNPAAGEQDISMEDLEAVRAWRSSNETAKSPKQFKRKGGDMAALAKL